MGGATMKSVTLWLGTVRVLLWGAAVCAQAPAAGSAKPPADAAPVIASVESRWDSVYCDLLEFSRSSPTELTVRWRYRNAGKQPLAFPDLSNEIRQSRLLDPLGRVVYEPLEDADRNTVGSSTIQTGSIKSGKRVAPGALQIHWTKFVAPPADVSAMSVVPFGCLPFVDVAIGQQPGDVAVLAAPRPALATQQDESGTLDVSVVELRRAAGNMLAMTVRYSNNGTKPFSFPALSNTFKNAYIVDPKSRQKFEIPRDKEQNPLAGTTVEPGSIPSGVKVPPGHSFHIWAYIAAPPPNVQTVTVTIPDVAPLEQVPISGTGGGSAGRTLTGAATGLAEALRDLGARVSDKEIRIALDADVLFDFDKADIKPAAENALAKVSDVLKAHPGARVTIEGHTDSKGDEAYNQKLSERRAQAVAEWLASHAAVAAGNVSARGWGKSRPVAENTKPNGSDNPEGRAQNRRVEIVVHKGSQ
jgi:outer membrane protein OmpA-like peptidoglycan-associated protein